MLKIFLFLFAFSLFSYEIKIENINNFLENFGYYELPDGKYFNVRTVSVVNLGKRFNFVKKAKEKLENKKFKMLKSIGLVKKKGDVALSETNSIFLAYLLEKLDLVMIDGKIFHDYDAEYIKRLAQMESEIKFKNALNKLRELDPRDFEYLVAHDNHIFYENDETNMYYIYNIYEENSYKNINLNKLLSDNIIITKYASSDDYKAMENYATYSYYLSSLLIESHHVKYEAFKSLIENLGFMENQGIDFNSWVEAANSHEMEGQNIWEVLGIDKNASLDKNAEKNINIVEIFKNYSKFTNAVKAELGLAVEILDDDYDLTSMFFDPMSAVLLAKSMADKGYHIALDEDGNKAIFDSNDIKIDLMVEIDNLIADIKSKQNSYLGNFGNLFNNTSLSGFLNGIDAQNSADFNEIMEFLNYSFTRDPRTGERLFSFHIGMNEIQDRILWNRITGSVGNYVANGMTFGSLTYFGDRIKNNYLNIVINDYNARMVAVEGRKVLRLPPVSFNELFNKKFNDIRNGYIDRAENIPKDKAIYNEMLIRSKAYLSDLNTQIANLDKNRKKLNQEIRILKREIEELNNKINFAGKLLDKAAKNLEQVQNNYNQNPSQDNEDALKSAKDAYLVAKAFFEKAKSDKKAKEEAKKKVEKEKKENENKEHNKCKEHEEQKALIEQTNERIKGKPIDPMCRPDAYNKECDSGVGPAGDPRLILMKKGGLGRKLLEIANKRVANIPVRECNVITRTCDGNSVEITAQELQVLNKNNLTKK